MNLKQLEGCVCVCYLYLKNSFISFLYYDLRQLSQLQEVNIRTTRGCNILPSSKPVMLANIFSRNNKLSTGPVMSFAANFVPFACLYPCQENAFTLAYLF